MISSAGYAEGIVPVLCLMGELDWDCCKRATMIKEYQGTSTTFAPIRIYKKTGNNEIKAYKGTSTTFAPIRIYKIIY